MARKQSKKKSSPVITQSARPAKPLFRLIPLTILMACGLLALKVVEIVEDGKEIHQALLIGQVVAEDSKEAAEEAAQKAEAEMQDEENASDESGEDSSEIAAAEDVPPAPPVDIMEQRKSDYNQRELAVLENLAKRREKLDSWEKEIALREKVLEATETRIDGKIAEMQKLSDDIKKLLVAYNDEEDTKLRSLVKIYESMKPKQAAPIFEKMDMQILLMVVDRMSERRVAPILAQMSPSRAKEVTEQLAEERLKRPQLSPELIEE